MTPVTRGLSAQEKALSILSAKGEITWCLMLTVDLDQPKEGHLFQKIQPKYSPAHAESMNCLENLGNIYVASACCEAWNLSLLISSINTDKVELSNRSIMQL